MSAGLLLLFTGTIEIEIQSVLLLFGASNTLDNSKV